MTTYMTNIFMQQHLQNIGIAATVAGTLIGALSLASMVFRPFSGWICDRFIKKKVLLAFTIITGGCLAGYGLAVSAPVILVLRTLHGIAFGMTTTAIMAYVSKYIPSERLSEGMGCFALGQSIATAIGPSIGLYIFKQFGDSWTFYFTAFLSAGCCVLIMMLPMSAENGNKTPLPLRQQLHFGNFFAKEAIMYAILTVAIAATNGIEVSYIASYAQSLGIENAGWYFTLSACTLFVSRALLGKITDRIGFRYIFFIAVALLCIAFLMLGYANQNNIVAILAISSVIKALGMGAVQPGLQAMCMRAVNAERRGAASGTYYIGADLGNGLSTVIGGRIVAVHGYSGLFSWMVFPLLISAGIYTVALLRKYRREDK